MDRRPDVAAGPGSASRPPGSDVWIWIRRAAAVLAGFVFALLLAATLTLEAVDSALHRPQFLPEQLERADVYRFVTTDLLTALLEDARRLEGEDFDSELEGNPLVTSGLTTVAITDAVGRALPPEELARLTDPAIARVWSSISGEGNLPPVRIDAGARLRALVGELTTLLRESGAYESLLDGELAPIFAGRVDEALTPQPRGSGWAAFLRGRDDRPGGDLATVFGRVVTAEWVAGQVEQAAAALTAYLTDRSAGLTLHVGFDDAQLAQIAAELEAIVAQADAYDLAYTTVVEPVAGRELDDLVELPYGVPVTSDEVLDAVRGAMPRRWVDQQAAALARAASSYVTGQSPAFTVAIDLAPIKRDAAETLSALAVSSLRDTLASLPACSTVGEAETARAAIEREVPACMPPGVAAGDIVEIAAPRISSSISESVLSDVPDTVRYTDLSLRDALAEDGGPEALAGLDDLREFFAEGWTYTEADLRADLSDDPDASDLIEDVRSLFSDGYVIEPSDGRADGARQWVHALGRGVLGAGLTAALLLLLVAFLGGRGWRGRISWGAAALLASAALIALVSGPLYQAATGALLDAIRAELVTDPGSKVPLASELLVNKLLELGEGVADAVVGRIARNGLILAVVAMLALAVSVSWERIARALGRQDT